MASSSAETGPKLFPEVHFANVFKKWYATYGGSVIPVRSSAGPKIEKDVGDERINIDDDRACGVTIDQASGKETEMPEHGLDMRLVWVIDWPKSDKDASNLFIKNGFEVMYKAGKGIGVDEFGGEKLGDILLGSTAQVGSSLIVHHLTSSTPSAGSYILAGANGVAFVAILMSKLLGGYKNKRAALLLRKMGSIAASSAIIMAMTMFVPASQRLWVSSLACLLPAIAVALA